MPRSKRRAKRRNVADHTRELPGRSQSEQLFGSPHMPAGSLGTGRPRLPRGAALASPPLSEIPQDFRPSVERAATMERAAVRARESAAGDMTYPLAVRADPHGCGCHDDFGARVACERTLGTNLREAICRHLVASEHSDNGAPMSSPAMTSRGTTGPASRPRVTRSRSMSMVRR